MKREKVRAYPLAGRHWLTLGALALLGLSGYELWIRLEDFWAWTRGIRHLSAVRGTPFVQDLAIVFEAPEMRKLGFKLLFLSIAIVFALICVLWRRRATGAWLIIVMDLVVMGAGVWLGLYSYHPGDWAQALKLIPLLLILVGGVVNIIHDGQLRRGAGRQRQSDDQERPEEHRRGHVPGPGGVR